MSLIVAFSTSSPWTSVCVLSDTGEVLWQGERHAPGQASGSCLELLGEGLQLLHLGLDQATLFASDLGPGSFTGVRVGVVLAKTLAWTQRVRCVGATSFDLVDPEGPVALPSKKGEFFVRVPGQDPVRIPKPPEGCVGYGFDGGVNPPSASGFSRLLRELDPIEPELFVPAYLIEPSISQSKKPLARVAP